MMPHWLSTSVWSRYPRVTPLPRRCVVPASGSVVLTHLALKAPTGGGGRKAACVSAGAGGVRRGRGSMGGRVSVAAGAGTARPAAPASRHGAASAKGFTAGGAMVSPAGVAGGEAVSLLGTP